MLYTVTLCSARRDFTMPLGTFKSDIGPSDAIERAKKKHHRLIDNLVTGTWEFEATPAPPELTLEPKQKKARPVVPDIFGDPPVPRTTKVRIGSRVVVATLGKDDLELADRLGEARQLANERAGTLNKAVDLSRRGARLNIEGVAGEIAFCRAFGVNPDQTIGVRSGGVDAVVGGLRWDIKATRYPDGKLAVLIPTARERNKYQDIDAFALARLHRYPPHVYLIGWTLKADLCRPEHVGKLGNDYRENWLLPGDRLRPLREIEGISGETVTGEEHA